MERQTGGQRDLEMSRKDHNGCQGTVEGSHVMVIRAWSDTETGTGREVHRELHVVCAQINDLFYRP
jgi:hypothetical protein